ncbi:hypothetical protein DDN83_17645 [Vibrio cholerae]|nr:hypothetical protein [Vibrio cholerae]EGR4217834.1 hypothetical protein [Vibrio cholerae]EGR4344241.1 hypothetical protein [Vibrio cholerae]
MGGMWYFAAGFQLKQYLVIHPVSFPFWLNRFSKKGKKFSKTLNTHDLAAGYSTQSDLCTG